MVDVLCCSQTTTGFIQAINIIPGCFHAAPWLLTNTVPGLIIHTVWTQRFSLTDVVNNKTEAVNDSDFWKRSEFFLSKSHLNRLSLLLCFTFRQANTETLYKASSALHHQL